MINNLVAYCRTRGRVSVILGVGIVGFLHVPKLSAQGEGSGHSMSALRAGGEGSVDWCKDSGTYCFNEKAPRALFAGLRIIGEPKFGAVIPRGDNRIETSEVGKLSVLGVETTLSGALLAFQLSFITPGRVKLDDDSQLRVQNRLQNTNGEIPVDYGYAFGFSVINGAITFGYGTVNFDSRQIVNPSSSDKKSHYLYVNFQAISAIRAALASGKQ
jgi:hypothetical protein